MTFTREEIMGMEPGEEFDALIGKEVVGAVPAIQWWAMDREEKGIFITFKYESEANEWMEDQARRFPSWNEKNGTHIVRKEIFRNYSGSISAAWEVVEKFNMVQIEYVEWFVNNKSTNAKISVPTSETEFKESEATGKTAPEAICKAALLAVLNL